MAGERFVVLGLAHVRSPWFSEVARWSTAGSAPVEFVKCLTAEEVRSRLASGRPFSALLIDGRLPAADRDLFDTASQAGCPTLVVETADQRDWARLGVVGTLSQLFDRSELLDALDRLAAPVADTDAAGLDPQDAAAATGWRGRLVGVTGAGGAGASTIAMALGQGFGDDVRNGGLVLLADLALKADHALLHHAGDVVPGVQELVDAHRRGRPGSEQVRSLTFDVPDRRYRLLLGLRRHRDWAALRPRSFEAALDGLRRSYRTVVADIDPDVEGADQCGSTDVEERNLMARTVTANADAVVVIGCPGLTGMASLVRTTHALRDQGVSADRLLVAVNRAPRSQRARAELSRAFAELSGQDGSTALAAPIFLPDRRGLDQLVQDGGRLPSNLATTVTKAVEAVIDHSAERVGEAVPERIEPGSLGTWIGGAAAG